MDAIVDMGDTSRDWRLDFEEFTTIFTPGYKPPQKRELATLTMMSAVSPTDASF